MIVSNGYLAAATPGAARLRCRMCGRPSGLFTILQHPTLGPVLVCKKPTLGEAPIKELAWPYCAIVRARPEGKRS